MQGAGVDETAPAIPAFPARGCAMAKSVYAESWRYCDNYSSGIFMKSVMVRW